jgi:hypothetical protein
MSNSTFGKRQKERNRQDKQREKLAKRMERSKTEKPDRPFTPGEDPDIAGIIPGPQPKEEEDE